MIHAEIQDFPAILRMDIGFYIGPYSGFASALPGLAEPKRNTVNEYNNRRNKTTKAVGVKVRICSSRRGETVQGRHILDEAGQQRVLLLMIYILHYTTYHATSIHKIVIH